MTIDIEETVAKLRKAKNEDELFHKIRKCEKEYVAEIERFEDGKDKELIKDSIGKLMTFYKRALEIATFEVTPNRILANIRLWESHASSVVSTFKCRIKPRQLYPSIPGCKFPIYLRIFVVSVFNTPGLIMKNIHYISCDIT